MEKYSSSTTLLDVRTAKSTPKNNIAGSKCTRDIGVIVCIT